MCPDSEAGPLPQVHRVPGPKLSGASHSVEIKIDQSPAAAAIMQDYLAALAQILALPDSRHKSIEILRAYAELRYRLVGGGHCSVCRAHVRHVLPITTERFDGETKDYDCLCTRCFEGERSVSRKISVRAGTSSIEFCSDEPSLKGEPHPGSLWPGKIIY